MKIDLTGKQRSEYRQITVGEDSFEIQVTSPSLADQLVDGELLSLGNQADGKWIEHRLQSTMTGWHRVNDQNDDPIVFSWEALVALITQCPEVYPQLVNLAHAAYRGLDEDQKKN